MDLTVGRFADRRSSPRADTWPGPRVDSWTGLAGTEFLGSPVPPSRARGKRKRGSGGPPRRRPAERIQQRFVAVGREVSVWKCCAPWVRPYGSVWLFVVGIAAGGLVGLIFRKPKPAVVRTSPLEVLMRTTVSSCVGLVGPELVRLHHDHAAAGPVQPAGLVPRTIGPGRGQRGGGPRAHSRQAIAADDASARISLRRVAELDESPSCRVRRLSAGFRPAQAPGPGNEAGLQSLSLAPTIRRRSIPSPSTVSLLTDRRGCLDSRPTASATAGAARCIRAPPSTVQARPAA